MDELNAILVKRLEDLSLRLGVVEDVLWPLSARALIAERGAGDIAAVGAHKGVERPLQTDGLGEWPAEGQLLPEGWSEIPQEGGRPTVTQWDPWNPEIPKSGKVITFDSESDLFRIECGGVRYEIPWKELEPAPPFSNPGPPERHPNPPPTWVKVTPAVKGKRFYFRQAHCKTQITCVVTYEVQIELYRPWQLYEDGRVEWLTYPRYDRTTRTEARRRTSDFTCPQQGA